MPMFGANVSHKHGRLRRGFTLIEVLVVLAVLLLLLSILIPAVLAAREAGRRSECTNKLRQLGLSANAFAESQGHWPLGGNSLSAFSRMLPYLGQETLFAAMNFDNLGSRFASGSNQTAYRTQLGIFLCPSDLEGIEPSGHGPCNYAGNVGYGFDGEKSIPNGPFAATIVDPRIRVAQIRDGLSRTAAISEFCRGSAFEPRDASTAVFELDYIELEAFQSFMGRCNLVQFGKAKQWPVEKGRAWAEDGLATTLYNHNNPPNHNSCTHGNFLTGSWAASSRHSGGANLVYLDGHVEFVRDSIDPSIWRGIGSINGGELADSP